ncbi:MAG TPA: ATP-binding cassette domain-containing protein [Dehalococcoidales bacterium]|nr:ATP-binding cassette domain-containing protein [Dehalococcoidales bacterium]
MDTINVSGLTKVYPRVKAVDNVSFTINHGEVFGFLGPNGAGKTTTIKILLTLLRPTAGTINIFGIDALARPEKVREIAGYVPQDVSVDGDLTGYENMLIYAKLYRIPGHERAARIKETLEYLQIFDRAPEMVSTYSGGMMRRLEIAQSLINHPRVLFLDEPSIGLDPSARRHMWELIKKLRDQFGATILINTHDMSEADFLCDRLAIMDRGKLIITGTPEELKAKVGGDVLTICSESAECQDKLQKMGYSVMMQPTNHHIDLLVSSGESVIPPLLESLKAAGVAVESVSLKKPSLDDVFLKYTGTRMDERDTWQSARKSRRTLRKLTG